MWRREGCRIIQAQTEDTGETEPLYYPEAISGEPRLREGGRKDVFFLGINPGCSLRAGGDLSACPNRERDAGMSETEYAARHLTWFNQPLADRHSDAITSASLWLLLSVGGPEPETLAPKVEFGTVPFSVAVDQGLLSHLVELNMAHCKCSKYTKRFGTKGPSRMTLACEDWTLSALSIWKPRSVVVMGGPQWFWLKKMVDGRGPHAGWRVDCEEHLPDCPDYGESTTLHWHDAQELTTELIAAYHPSHPNRYTLHHARTVADRVRETLNP